MDVGAEHAGHRRFTGRTTRLAAWTLVWLLTIGLAKLGPGFLWGAHLVVLNWAGVVVNLIVGIVWIVAFTHYLRGLDELQRKVMLDALAITLGIGWVAGFAYATASAIGLISPHVDLVAVPVLLAATYLVAVAVGRLRYR